MKNIDRFNYTQEAIAFQDGKLFNEVAAIFAKVKSAGYTKGILKDLKLNETVFKHTGISVSCEFHPETGWFHVYPPQISHNNIVLANADTFEWHYEVGMKLTYQSRVPLKGTVDTKRCRVGGVFSEMTSVVQMDPGFLTHSFYDMSPEEYAAIFLHELGHVFTYFEFLTETVTTNQYLSSITKRLLEINNYDDRVVFISNVEHDLDMVVPDKDTLAKSNNGTSIYGVLVSSRRDAVRSSTDTWVYDYKTWEFLSDQFSIRVGSGKHLAAGLYKLVNAHGGIKTTRIDIFFSSVTMTLMSIGMIVGGLSGAGPVIFGIGIFIATIGLMNAASIQLHPHDDNVQRLTRMKHEVLEQLKTEKISKEYRLVINDHVEAIEKMLKTMEDTRGMYETLFDYLLPHKRNARNQYEFQMKMEKLAGNSMFLNSSKLQALT